MSSSLEECHTTTVVKKIQVCFDPAAYPAGSTLHILLPLLPLRCLCFSPFVFPSVSGIQMLIIRICYWVAFFFPFSCKDKLISQNICSFGFWLQGQFATSKISSCKYLCHLDENTSQHKKVSDCWTHKLKNNKSDTCYVVTSLC